MLDRVGHNRTNRLVEEARLKAERCSEALVQAELSTQKAQLDALAAIYELDCWFTERPTERESFYEAHKIGVDPRAKHTAQPLVKHFLVSDELTKALRNKVTLWAGAITEAHRQNVTPDEFIAFIKNTPEGILGAYMAASRAQVSKDARLEAAEKLNTALDAYRRDIKPIRVSLSDYLQLPSNSKHMAVLEVDEDGNVSLSAILNRSDTAAEQAYSDHVLEWYDNGQATPAKAQPKSKRRYENAKKREEPIVLSWDEPAVLESRTRHPHLVVTPSENEWVLKSGEHSRKLGSVVTKGKWKGFPIYGLSLEERATCPSTCKQWLNCYGNGMGQMRAFRYRHGPKLIDALERELTILSSEPKTRNGFVVRLHTLGDFFDLDYVRQWEQWLEVFPALRVFGFTAWEPETEIGSALRTIRDANWDRFAMRFSNQPHERFASSVIGSEDQGPEKGTGIFCPAELGQTASCSTCGYCWHSEKHVSFLEH